MAIDFTQSPEQIITDLVNANNGTSFTPSMFSFGTPVPVAGAENTQLIITSADVSQFTGSFVLLYPHVDLSTVPGTRSTTFDIGQAVNISDLIPSINAAYGINLTAADFVDGPLPELPTNVVTTLSFNLQADATSLVYIGKVTLSVTNGVLPLSALVTVTNITSPLYTPPTT